MSILSTDKYVRSFGRDCMRIKSVAHQERRGKPIDPFDKKLFSAIAPQAICRKDITYKLNKQAKTFGELFEININKYTLDSFHANSCYLSLIVDFWHDAFERRKSDGKRMSPELTYESICQSLV